MTHMMIIFVILTLMIGVSAATHMQYVSAASNDNSNSCRLHHGTSDNSGKCSPFLLPFPWGTMLPRICHVGEPL